MKIRENKGGKGKLNKINRCLECDSEFLSNRSTAMYCSVNCKSKNKRKMKHKEFIKYIKAKYNI